MTSDLIYELDWAYRK